MIIMGSRFPTPQKYLVLMDWLLSISVWMRLMMTMLFSCRQPITLTAFPVYLWISIWLSLNGDRIASKVLSPWLIMRVLTGTAII